VTIRDLFSGREIAIHNFVAVQNRPDVFRVYADFLTEANGVKSKIVGMRRVESKISVA
jgi:hypothetical protein